MKITGGRLRGRDIFCPAGDRVRPVLGRLREAIFSSLGGLEDMSILDLFSGIGSLGIESLSRGASHAEFVESDKEALQYLRRNVRHLALEDVTTIVSLDVYAYLSEIHCSPGTYHVVFIDPPYDRGNIARLADCLETILARTELAVVKHSVREKVGWGIEPLKVLKRGDDRITILRGGV